MLLLLLLLLLEMSRLWRAGRVAGRAARRRWNGTGVVHHLRVAVSATGRRSRSWRARITGLLLLRGRLLPFIIHPVLQLGLDQVEMIQPTVGSHYLRFPLATGGVDRTKKKDTRRSLGRETQSEKHGVWFSYLRTWLVQIMTGCCPASVASFTYERRVECLVTVDKSPSI